MIQEHTQVELTTDSTGYALLRRMEGTVERLDSLVLQPFETWATAKGTGTVYAQTNPDLEITVVEKESKRRVFGDKEVLALVDSYINQGQRDSELGRNRYGFKRFDGELCVDPALVLEHIRGLRAETETSTSYGVELSGQILDVANAYRGELAGLEVPLTVRDVCTELQAGIYAAAVRQVRGIGRKIPGLATEVRRFRAAAKALAPENPEHAEHYFHDVGPLIAHVQSIPQRGVDSKKAMADLEEFLGNQALLTALGVDGKTTFWNAQLQKPRPYVTTEAVRQASAAARDGNATLSYRKPGPVVLHKNPDSRPLFL